MRKWICKKIVNFIFPDQALEIRIRSELVKSSIIADTVRETVKDLLSNNPSELVNWSERNMVQDRISEIVKYNSHKDVGQIMNTVQANTTYYIQSEAFIDSIVRRIKDKQLS